MSHVWFLLALELLFISPVGLSLASSKAEYPHRLFNDTTWILHERDNDVFLGLTDDGFKPFHDHNDALAICISVASLFINCEYFISGSKLDRRHKRLRLHAPNIFLQGHLSSVKSIIHGRLPSLGIIDRTFTGTIENKSYRNDTLHDKNSYITTEPQKWLDRGYTWIFQIRRNIEPSPVVAAPIHTLDGYYREVLDGAPLFDRMRYEWARYETFQTFPNHSPAMPSRLSNNGFFYTGVSDQVQCFSCKVKYSNWADGDIVSDVHERMSPTCRHVIGTDQSNVPIHDTRERIQEQSTGTNQSDIQTDAIRHDQSEKLHFSIQESNPSSNDRFKHSTCDSMEAYKHPAFEDIDRRKESFSAWENVENHNTGELNEIVQAGFFYSDSGRCLRCFSCGFGYRDIPMSSLWDAHDPTCKYLQSKGKHGHLAVTEKQSSTNHLSFQTSETLNSAERSNDTKNDSSRQTSSELTIPNTNDNKADNKTGQLAGMPQSISKSLTEQLIDMGFEEKQIQTLVATHRDTDLTIDTLMEALLKTQKDNTGGCRVRTDNRNKQRKEKYHSSNSNSKPDALTETGRRSLNEDFNRLMEQMRCKICMDETSAVVVIPCGHFCTCATCIVKCRKCPICRTLIRQTIPVAR